MLSGAGPAQYGRGDSQSNVSPSPRKELAVVCVFPSVSGSQYLCRLFDKLIFYLFYSHS